MECLLVELSMKSNIEPTQNITRERLAGMGEQATLSLLKNISHCTMMEGEEEEDPGLYAIAGR
jgi:hypothetical protein